jgi:hypothetical protein
MKGEGEVGYKTSLIDLGELRKQRPGVTETSTLFRYTVVTWRVCDG